MIEFDAVKEAFPELDLDRVVKDSGQRVVFAGQARAGPVVLKVLHPDPGGADRLAREISAVATLGSERVPEIIDYGFRSSEVSG